MEIAGLTIAVGSEIQCAVSRDRGIRVVLDGINRLAYLLRVAPVIVNLVEEPNVPISAVWIRFGRSL